MKLDPKIIDPSKALGFLDSLVDKIPDEIAKLLKKIAIALFIFFLLIAAYYGWNLGYGDAQQDGMKLAEDTKSLFYDEIERDYNRKRKNINLSEIDLDISRKVDEAMIRDSLRFNQQNSNTIMDSNSDPMTENADLNSQRKESGLPPAMNVPDLPSREWLPGRDASEEKQAPVIERLEKQIQESESDTSRLEKTLDKLESLEKKSSNQDIDSTNEKRKENSEKRELIRAPKAR
jgi:hypothetical protein